MYAPEIDSLWEADLAFVQHVAKENDGVNYLLVVIDVFFQVSLGKTNEKQICTQSCASF